MTAQQSSTRSTSFKQHANRKHQTLQLLKSIADMALELKDDECAKHLQEGAARLQDEQLLVVVCGEFKRGKTSLINAMLEDESLLPVDVHVTTCIATLLRYGAPEEFLVIAGERGNESSQVISREQLIDYVSESSNRNNARKARMAVCTLPNFRLAEGMILVDTPGVGGLNVDHTDLTFTFVPKADVVLFVSDVQNPLSSAELKFVSMIYRHCRHVIQVVTKIDSEAGQDLDRILAENRLKIAETVNIAPNAITMLPVSSLNKLDYLKSKDQRDLDDSRFEALEAEIWKLLGENRGRTLIIAALTHATVALGQLRAPLITELQACEDKDRTKLQELEDQWASVSKRLGDLLQNNARWRAELADGLEDIGANARQWFMRQFDDIHQQAIASVENDNLLLKSPHQLAGIVETEIDATLSQLSGRLSRAAADLHAQIEESTGLALTAGTADVNALKRDSARTLTFPGMIDRHGVVQKALRVTRETTFNTTAGGTLGGVLGGAVGGIVGFIFGGVGAAPGAIIGAKIGAAFGGIGGLASGARTSLRTVHATDRNLARAQVLPILQRFLDQSKRECLAALDASHRGLRRTLRDEFEVQITGERQRVEALLKTIQNARRLSAAQAAEVAVALKRKIARIDQLNNAALQALTSAMAENPIEAPGHDTPQSEAARSPHAAGFSQTSPA